MIEKLKQFSPLGRKLAGAEAEYIDKINEIISVLNSKPECGDSLMRIPLTLQEMSDLYEQKKMPHEFMPGESKAVKPKEVEKCPDCEINGRMNCATHGKPYKDCVVKPKDSLEDVIKDWWKANDEGKSANWYSKDLANAVRGWMLDNVEILYCKKESPVGWIAMDDVKRMLE